MNKMNKKVELNYLRSILCVFVVVTHLFTQYSINTSPDDKQIETLYWVRMLFIIGTPGFIMLSQVLITMNYKIKLPPNFLLQRIKYILIPYLFVGTYYSFSEYMYLRRPFNLIFYDAVIKGNWYGYFILVIFQFYLLTKVIYFINQKFNINIFKSKIIITISVIINMVYLYNFENNAQFSNLVENHYYFSPNTFIFGWIGYYLVGSFIGLYYEEILNFLSEYISIMIFSIIISYVFFIFSQKHDFWSVTSFNWSIFPYCIVMFLAILVFAKTIIPFMFKFFTIVSAYSFFIYLIHPMLIDTIYVYTSRFQGYTILFIIISVLITLGCCIGIGLLFKEMSFSKFIVGKGPFQIEEGNVKVES
ncbi:acyltransferase family protein [Macrococcoides canis]|nr:acyltransferase family protein [Macrococcus canis]